MMIFFGIMFLLNIFDTKKGNEKKEKVSALFAVVFMALVYLSSRP